MVTLVMRSYKNIIQYNLVQQEEVLHLLEILETLELLEEEILHQEVAEGILA